MKELVDNAYHVTQKAVLLAVGVLLANPNNIFETLATAVIIIWSILITIQVMSCMCQTWWLRQFLSKGKDLINDVEWRILDAHHSMHREGMKWGGVMFVLFTVYVISRAEHFGLALTYFVIQSVHLITVYVYLESRKQISEMAKNRVLSLKMANNTG